MPSARAPLQGGPEGEEKGNQPAALHFWSSQEKQKAQMSHCLVCPLVIPSPALGPTLPLGPLSRLSHTINPVPKPPGGLTCLSSCIHMNH